MLTSIGLARSIVAARQVAGPRPTLDGSAYLAAGDFGAFRASREAAWLGYAEAGGRTARTPYTDTLRVPMFGDSRPWWGGSTTSSSGVTPGSRSAPVSSTCSS